MFALLISKLQAKMMLYLAKNRKLKMFPVQIQWEFASAVHCSSAAGGVSAVTESPLTARMQGCQQKCLQIAVKRYLKIAAWGLKLPVEITLPTIPA